MFTNSSSSLNTTPASPLILPSNSFISPFYEECQNSMASNVVFTIYTLIAVLVFLPLDLLILCKGLRQWRSHQPTSHSDCFTYHCVAMETVVSVGSLVYTVGIYTHSLMIIVGMFLSCIIFPGQTLFHLLTCVERYLAVVHPVTYVRLRGRGGVRIRSTSIACVWLLCFGWVGLTKLYLPDVPINPLLCMLAVSIIVICFCCLSVLCTLTHSGTGKANRKTEQADQSKQRAFHIICAIVGVLLLRFVALLITFSLSYLHWASDYVCVLMDIGIFLTVPSSLALPLLFLHKTGTLAWCGRNES